MTTLIPNMMRLVPEAESVLRGHLVDRLYVTGLMEDERSGDPDFLEEAGSRLLVAARMLRALDRRELPVDGDVLALLEHFEREQQEYVGDLEHNRARGDDGLDEDMAMAQAKLTILHVTRRQPGRTPESLHIPNRPAPPDTR